MSRELKIIEFDRPHDCWICEDGDGSKLEIDFRGSHPIFNAQDPRDHVGRKVNVARLKAPSIEWFPYRAEGVAVVS